MFNTKQINIVVHPPSCIRLLLLSLGGDPGNVPGMFFYTGESSIRSAASACCIRLMLIGGNTPIRGGGYPRHLICKREMRDKTCYRGHYTRLII